MNHFYDAIHGNFDFDDIYRQAVEEAKDGSVLVEVGAYLGKSTAFLGVEAVNSKKDITIFVVDTWKGSQSEPTHMQEMANLGGDSFPHWFKAMREGGVLHMMKPLRMESTVAALSFADKSVDFVFIDADHRYECVHADIKAWLPKVKPGGVIAGHDFEREFPGVFKAVKELVPDAVCRNKSWWKRIGA